MSELNRILIPKVRPDSLQLYRVVLVGGPYDGMKSICSHDTVYIGGTLANARYVRGADDRYYYSPEDLK